MSPRDSLQFPRFRDCDVIWGGKVTLCRNPADQPFKDKDVFEMEAPWLLPAEISKAYASVEAEEAELARSHKLSWNSDFGYLSPDPRHCGTGLIIQGTFHLEGISLIGDMATVLNGLNAVRCTFHPLKRESFEHPAHLYWINNYGILGITERQLLARIQRIFEALVLQELNARKSLLLDSPRIVEDALCRSLALLRNARFMTPGELLDLLSPICLGVTMGLLDGITRGDVRALMMKQINAPILPPSTCAEDDRRLDKRDSDLADWINRRFSTVRFSQRAEQYFS